MIIVTPDAPVESLWPDRRTPQQTRILHALWREDVVTIGGLINCPAGDLLDLHDFGPGRLAEVRRVLASRGLSLRGEAGEPS